MEIKNYRILVDRAESAHGNGRYLEAFLIQSCIFEGVVKSYGNLMLKHIFDRSTDLKRKSDGFEFSRMIDELFISGKITKKLYDSLHEYRKQRNKVIHKILGFDNNKIFERELKKAYELGRDMKVFIVEEMIRKEKGKTMAELAAKLEHDLGEFNAEHEVAFNREMPVIMAKLSKNIKDVLRSQKK